MNILEENIQEKLESNAQLLSQAKKQYYSKYFYEFNRDILTKNSGLYEPLHRKVCDFVINNVDKKKILILLPRGSFKSTLVTVGYSLYRIVQNPNDRILIANATYPMATQFLGQIKNHLQRNEDLKQIFGDFSTDADQWREDKIFIGGDKAYIAKEPTIWAQGVTANVTGSHFNIAILDDLVNDTNIGTKEQIEKVKQYYRQVLDLVDPDEKGHRRVIMIGCFVRGTKVLMGDGSWRNIEEVESGEKVMTRDGVRKVISNIYQGKSEVFELKSRNATIKGTKNHPFLRNGEWIKMENLKKNDNVSFFRLKIDGNREIEPDLAWALGYMVGDGWVTIHPNKKGSIRYVVGIAEGIYEDRNKKIVDIFESKFECKFKNVNRCYVVTCAKLGRWLLEHGLERGAKNKKVPDFIFEQDLDLRHAFLNGFLDADGWKEKDRKVRWHERKGKLINRFSYEVSSRELAYGVRRLAITSGSRVNNIYSRSRKIKAPNSKIPINTTTYHCSLSFDEDSLDLGQIGETKVVSIKEVGKEDVWDLSIEGEHSFIAEGFVVHNTTWHWDDLYAWIQETPEIAQDFAILKLPAYTGDFGTGELLFPTRLGWSALEQQKRQQGSFHFSAQYMLDPIPTDEQVFRPPFKTYEETDLRGIELKKFVTVDPAISEEKTADYSAMVCVGVDKNNDWYILDIWRERVQPKALIDQIFYWNEKHKPVSVGIETVAFQKALQYFIYDEMKRRNRTIPLIELKNNDRSKDERIRGLQPRYEMGSIFHPQKTYVPNVEYLEDELRRFPKNAHDDVIDALASHLELAFPPKKNEERHYVKRSVYPA